MQSLPPSATAPERRAGERREEVVIVMKRLVQLGVVLAFLLLCVATNPSKVRHQERIERSFAQSNEVLGKIGLGQFYAQSFSYHNLLVCSWTRDDEGIKSFGVLGMVFTF